MSNVLRPKSRHLHGFASAMGRVIGLPQAIHGPWGPDFGRIMRGECRRIGPGPPAVVKGVGMDREEITGYSHRRRPKTSWGLALCVLAAAIGLAHMAGLTEPLRTMAMQLLRNGQRDLSTPSSRLVGLWESDNDMMFTRVCYGPAHEPRGTGTYTGYTADNSHAVDYRILSEDRSGTNLAMWEYVQRVVCFERVDYFIAKDGQSMTKEYLSKEGNRVRCNYRYIGGTSSP